MQNISSIICLLGVWKQEFLDSQNFKSQQNGLYSQELWHFEVLIFPYNFFFFTSSISFGF